MKDVQRYTMTNYRMEMAEMANSMPPNWTRKAIEYLGERGEPGVERVRLQRVLRGMSYELGIRGGYINAIRRVHAEHNNTEYVELDPARVVTIEA